MQAINQSRSQVSLFRVSTVEETDDDDDEYIKKNRSALSCTQNDKLSIRRRPDPVPIKPHVLHFISILASVRSHADAKEAVA